MICGLPVDDGSAVALKYIDKVPKTYCLIRLCLGSIVASYSDMNDIKVILLIS